MGISLWIVPPPLERAALQKFMDKPPVRLPPGLSLPSFIPHITLGTFPSSTPVDKLKVAIPQHHGSLAVQFDSVTAGDHYFRSVFITIKLSEELARIHAHVHSALGLEANTPLFPHMSLFYIADDFAAERRALADKLAESGCVVPSEGGVGLVVNAIDAREGEEIQRNSGLNVLRGYESSEVWIALCDGPVSGWTVLDRIPLSS